MSGLTRIINTLREGNLHGEEEGILSVYRELRALAREKMRREDPNHTLQPTALVHEVWVRLIARSRTKWENRAEFFSAAAEAMRRILVDHARRKNSRKRGGQWERTELEEASLILTIPPDELLAVDEALDELSRQDALVAELVKLRYYVGMSMKEAATVLGVTPRAAERLWTFGRAWLRDRIRSGQERPISATANES
jgi:RNA polymerase sigma factor (TIGR02999 family)